MSADLWEANGRCGGLVAPNARLPLLLGIDAGELVERCPVAEAQSDPDVMGLVPLMPSPYGAGLFADCRLAELPPRYRGVLVEARAWFAAWEVQLREPDKRDCE